jgi:hypothetical protein
LRESCIFCGMAADTSFDNSGLGYDGFIITNCFY